MYFTLMSLGSINILMESFCHKKQKLQETLKLKESADRKGESFKNIFCLTYLEIEECNFRYCLYTHFN